MRLPPLDGLRGIAISMVLVFHCFYLAPGGFFSSLSSTIASWMWLGVDLFFVLSGYLITTALLATRESPGYFGGFYRRRIARIWPAFFVVMTYVVVVYPILIGTPTERMSSPMLPWIMTLMQNWHQIGHATYETWGTPHFWSLAVEEQFYLFWPLVILLVPRQHQLRICIGVLLASVALRALVITQSTNVLVFYELTPCRLDGFAAGAAVAIYAQGRIVTQTLSPWIVRAERIGLLLLMTAFVFGAKISNDFRWAWSLAMSGNSLIIAAVVARCRLGHLPQWGHSILCIKPLQWMGRYSYGIYLIHYVLLIQLRGPIERYMPTSITTHGNLLIIITGVIVVALSLAWAWIMFEFIEAPALRWGARSRPKSIPTSA